MLIEGKIDYLSPSSESKNSEYIISINGEKFYLEITQKTDIKKLRSGAFIVTKIRQDENELKRFLKTDEMVVIPPPYSKKEFESVRHGFHLDEYIRAFKAKIIEIKDDNKIILDRTFFYPGGGGQESDNGWLNQYYVKKTYLNAENQIVHELKEPTPKFKVGDIVEGKINWEKRYDLMKAHTAEHLLIRFLTDMCPDCTLKKINLTADKKIVYIRGEVTWEHLLEVQNKVNQTIFSGKTVKTYYRLKDDITKNEKIRVNWERLEHKEKIRIVEIKDTDWAACTGLHVTNINEIGTFAILKLAKSRRDADYEIQFEVNQKSLSEILPNHLKAVNAAYLLKTSPKDLTLRITSLLKHNKALFTQNKYLTERLLAGIQPQRVGKYHFYTVIETYLNEQALKKWINKVVKQKNVIILVIYGEKTSRVQLHKSNDIDIDCKSILTNFVEHVGGTTHFATGVIEQNPEKLVAQIRNYFEML